jgi:hypothetical protein
MSVPVFWVHVSVCIVWSLQRPEEGTGVLELELQMVVSRQVCSGNWMVSARVSRALTCWAIPPVAGLVLQILFCMLLRRKQLSDYTKWVCLDMYYLLIHTICTFGYLWILKFKYETIQQVKKHLPHKSNNLRLVCQEPIVARENELSDLCPLMSTCVLWHVPTYLHIQKKS